MALGSELNREVDLAPDKRQKYKETPAPEKRSKRSKQKIGAFSSIRWMASNRIIFPLGIGWGVAGPALQALASRQVDETRQGFLQGGLTSISGLAAILGPATATGTFAWFTREGSTLHFPDAFFLLGAFFLLFAAWAGSRAGRHAPLPQQ